MRPRVQTCTGIALVAALLAGGVPPRPAFAIDGVVQNPSNGHWYKTFSSSTRLYWSSCKSSAESLGGYLVTITSDAENTWVRSNMVSWSYFAWIGASDAASEGNWAWVTGETWSYSNWGFNQPDNFNNVQHYAMFLSGAGGPWWDDVADDGGSYSVYRYVVEWDSDPNGVPPSSPPAAPSNLVASVSFGNPILLTWTDNSGNEEEFQVERRTDDTVFSRIATPGPNSTAYEDYGTAPDTAYTYRVRARNSGGVSDYSNEATATASPLAPRPRAPSNLMVIRATRSSVELQWADNSVDEIVYEVHRGAAAETVEYLATLPPESWSFTDADLPPDTEYVYAVRAANAYRASAFVQVQAATLPTLAVTAARGDLKDSPRVGKDSVKVVASWEPVEGESDGVGDPSAEGITLRLGTDSSPVVMSLPPGLPGWKAKGSRWTWKSPRGSAPKYRVQVDLERRLVTAWAAGLELAVPAANPMRVSLALGNDGGTARGDWVEKKPGVFRLR